MDRELASRQSMGRVVARPPPCCSESEKKVRKGLWSPEEDERLASHIALFGVSCWSSIPDLAGLRRCGKSCRLRWMNYLRPDLRRGRFSQREEDLIMALHDALGNSWSQIAARLPGRSDNEIKNFWNARLRKKLRQKETTAVSHGGGGEAGRKPAAVFNPYPHHSAPDEHHASPDGNKADTAVGNAVHRVNEARSDAALADAGHLKAAPSTSTSASTSKQATAPDHGGDDFLAAMVDDEASLLLGEYYLDGSHDGLFWGGHVFR